MSNMSSLASGTGTRTDSACKHIRVCKVAQDYVSNWLGVSLQQLKNEKLSYSVQKDDFFIACGKPLFSKNACFSNQKPYPVGLKHLKGLDIDAKKFIAMINHFCITGKQYYDVLSMVQKSLNSSNTMSDAALKAINGIPNFYMGGVALTTGHPHGHIGDTALSVLTGGMITVLNGPFHISAGDTITWIWDFEQGNFNNDGTRKTVKHGDEIDNCLDFFTHRFPSTDTDALKKALAGKTNIQDLFNITDITQMMDIMMSTNQNLNAIHENDSSTKRRKLFHDQQNCVFNPLSRSTDQAKHNSLPMLIPLPSNATYMDRVHSFGKCLSSARPFDKTDIQIQRQGL